MAAPTIDSVTPSTVPPWGQLVEIAGSGFRPPALPTELDPTAAEPVTISVTIGGVACPLVKVPSGSRLIVRAPALAQGQADVVVTNLDDDGTPISGETATLEAGLAYKRPWLGTKSDLLRLVERLILLMVEEVYPNVLLDENTDWTGEPGEKNPPWVSQLPAIVLTGPSMPEDRFYSENERRRSDSGGEYASRQVPYTVDLGFDVMLVSDSSAEMLNLMARLVTFMHRNKEIGLLRDPDHPELGSVAYDFDFAEGGQPKKNSVLGISNVRSAIASIVVSGFDVEELAGALDESVFDRGGIVDTVNLGDRALPPES